MLDIKIVTEKDTDVDRIINDINRIIYIHRIDPNTREGKKEAYELKSHWASRKNPFICINNDEDKVIKCFYSETGDDIINSCINYINSYDNSKSI